MRKLKSSTLTIAIIVLLAAAVVATYFIVTLSFGGTPKWRDNVSVWINIGDRTPDFTLMDIDGNKFSLSDYSGYVVIVNFMATWCFWCKYEMSDLVSFHENYAPQGVVMISIGMTTSETEEQLRRFQDDYSAGWTFARDTANVGVTYQVRGIPTKYIINQDGIIAWKHVGAASYSYLASEVDKLL